MHGCARPYVCAASSIRSFTKHRDTATRLPRSRLRNRRATKRSHCTLRRCDLRSRCRARAARAARAAINQVHAGCADVGARVRRLGCVAPRHGPVGVGVPRQSERAARRRQGVPKPQCAALPRRRCQCGQHASSRAGRNAPTLTLTLTLSTGSAGGPCLTGVLTGYSRDTQGAPSASACRPSGSRGCRSPHEPRHPALHTRRSANVVRSGTPSCVCSSDIQRHAARARAHDDAEAQKRPQGPRHVRARRLRPSA